MSSTWVTWLPIMTFMFLSFMGGGAYTPYLQLYFKQHGLSAVEIGVLTGVGPALAVVMPLFWGLVGDRSHQVRRLLAVTSALAAASFMALPLVTAFPALIAFSALCSAFSMAGGPLGTALILAEAERLGTDYGRLRMWGSVGFALGILGAGRLVSSLGTGAIFAAYAVPVLFSLLPLAWLREAEMSSKSLHLRLVWQTLANRNLQILLVASLLWRIAASGYYTFFTIFLNSMGAKPVLISAAWAMGLVGEVTVLGFSGRIAKRIGVRGLLAAGLLGSALRWAIYAVVPGPMWTLPVQLLHGLTFGATTTAAVLAVDRMFPLELRSTGQGVLSIVMWGVGGLLGSVLAGLLYQAVGVRWLFALSAATAAATGLLAYAALTARVRPAQTSLLQEMSSDQG